MSVLDLHSNKLTELPNSVLDLFNIKTLKISNNELSDINPRLALIDSLVRIAIEGNPLRSIKPSMRGAGAIELKKFLKMRMGDEEIQRVEKQQAKALHLPGATME